MAMIDLSQNAPRIGQPPPVDLAANVPLQLQPQSALPLPALPKIDLSANAPRIQAQPQPEMPSRGPRMGQVVNGYTYTGGDPNSQTSWSKLGAGASSAPAAAASMPAPGNAQPNGPNGGGQLPTGFKYNGWKFVGGDPHSPQSWQELHGDEFLQGLPVQEQHVIKLMIGGDMTPPTNSALKAPGWMKALSDAKQYDPTFSETMWPERVKMRQEFAGNSRNSFGGNIANVNTIIGHLGQLAADIPDTASHSFTPYNVVSNYIDNLFGGAGPGLYDQQANIVSTDLPSALRGSQTADEDIKRIKENLSRDASAEQKKKAVAQLVDAISSRVNESRSRWNNVMGPNAANAPEFLTPQSQRIMRALSDYATTGKFDAKMLKPDDPLNPSGMQGASKLPVMKSPEDARNLPKGTHFLTPDGREMIVP